jgi:nucleotide-binding universal stress UspA family protein
MKTLLVPFDFSPYAVAAFRTALKISQKSGAQILCVTVIPTELDWYFITDEVKAKNSQIQEEYDEAMEVLPSYLRTLAPAKAPITPIVKIGVPHELIIQVAKEHSPDLIVLGAYGKGKDAQEFIGSNLQKVLRNANCPVLAVKELLDGNGFRKIAFASNFEGGSKDAFVSIKPLIKLFRASVHLVFVNTPMNFTNSTEIDDRMNDFMKGHEEITFHKHTFSHTEVENGLVEFGELSKINLVVIVSGHHEKNPSYQIGTTETLIFQSDFAVLSIKV